MEEIYRISVSLADKAKLLLLTCVRKSACKTDLLWRAEGERKSPANAGRLPCSLRYADDSLRTILLSNPNPANTYCMPGKHTRILQMPLGLTQNSKFRFHLYHDTLALLFSRPVVSNSLQPPGLQHTRPPCPSPPLEVCPSLCPLHRSTSITQINLHNSLPPLQNQERHIL